MRNTGLVTHILPTSANLVGACMCAIPLVKLLQRNGWAPWIDESLALASLLFLCSAGLSYISLRHTNNDAKLENMAEAVFVVGLVVVFGALMILSWGIA